LAAYAAWFPVRTVFLCVVDPGVGGTRPSIFLEADGRWYIGPGNGLFELIKRRARETRSWDIDWKPKHLSQLSRATSSPRWQPCWRAVIRPPAGHVTMAEIAGRLAG
jgi:S-adenosylmethionine hydrolase